MSSDIIDTIEPILESAIKLQVSSRLSTFLVGKWLLGSNPVVGFLTSLVMKYIVSPALASVSESIYNKIVSHESAIRMAKLQEANDESTITDAFTNI